MSDLGMEIPDQQRAVLQHSRHWRVVFIDQNNGLLPMQVTENPAQVE